MIGGPRCPDIRGSVVAIIRAERSNAMGNSMYLPQAGAYSSEPIFSHIPRGKEDPLTLVATLTNPFRQR